MIHLENSADKLSRLKTLLGAESGSAWIEFMDYTTETLKEVLTSGKPKKSAIDNSLIGKFGFKSWKEMLEAPIEKNGLAWNLGSWNAWKRAYKLVQLHDYLRTANLTHSQINTIYNETKSDFPSSLADFESYLQERSDKQKYKHQHSLKEAQAQVQHLQQQLDSLSSELALKSQERDDFEQINQQNNNEISMKNELIDGIFAGTDELQTKILNKHRANTSLTSKNNELRFKKEDYDKLLSKVNDYNEKRWIVKIFTFRVITPKIKK